MYKKYVLFFVVFFYLLSSFVRFLLLVLRLGLFEAPPLWWIMGNKSSEHEEFVISKLWRKNWLQFILIKQNKISKGENFENILTSKWLQL